MIIQKFDYKPKVINCFLKDQERLIGELPICMQLEIEEEYKNVK